MLRILAIVLLGGNALLLAAQFGLFDRLTGADSGPAPQREPARLQRQVDPQALHILSPQAASAALIAATASAATTAAHAATAASNIRAQACLEAGPFSTAEAEVAARTLRDAGLSPASWQALTNEDSGAFMVYMGRYADRETLQRKHDELKRLKIEAEELRGKPELQPGLNLGRFDQRAAADAALANMAHRGVRSARVLTLRQAQSQTVLRLAAIDAATQARLAGLVMPSGPGFVACDQTPARPAAAVIGAAGPTLAASAGGSAAGGSGLGNTARAAAATTRRASAPVRAASSSAARAASAASAAGVIGAAGVASAASGQR